MIDSICTIYIVTAKLNSKSSEDKKRKKASYLFKIRITSYYFFSRARSTIYYLPRPYEQNLNDLNSM
jgi:hypothetical protein